MTAAREPAPPYAGEGPVALWHVSEDPGLSRFVPRRSDERPTERALVWAVDTRHLPLYWFPRDCPRGCAWASSTTSDEDRERFFAASDATRLHAVESRWAERLASCRLFAYELPSSGFEPVGEVGGYWVTGEAVEAVGCAEVGPLLERHAAAGIELRLTPSLRPFWEAVVASTLEYSGIRLRNARLG